jgi:hypothetical protein
MLIQQLLDIRVPVPYRYSVFRIRIRWLLGFSGLADRIRTLHSQMDLVLGLGPDYTGTGTYLRKENLEI